ncbi:MAG: pilus assembly protein [Actinobacteria bacterium]|nr:pilus assembly protein [Actinomycetota bacterium]
MTASRLHRLRDRLRSDEGAAVVEFVVLVVLVIVPVAYAVIAVMSVQSAAYAVTQAARESARAFTQADTLGEARSAARLATRIALSDQGVPLRGDELRIDCDGTCLAPGTTIRVSVGTRVRLPFLPESLADSTVGAVPVSAEHLAVIDDYREAP